MAIPDEYNFPRYLASKKSVDDRALNQGVWQSLDKRLRQAAGQPPVQVLEVGAGTGAMLERMLRRGMLPAASYTALDLQPDNIAEACQRLPEWAAALGYQVEPAGENAFHLQDPPSQVFVQFVVADLYDFAARQLNQASWDLLVAHAFLDLLDIPTALPVLATLLRPGGLFYTTINFDGATILEPALDPAFDSLVEALYHRTMDNRITAGRPSGDSRAGRRLFSALHRAGFVTLDAGASDWVVFPQGGVYPHDEAYFLHFIIHTLHTALSGHPGLEPARFEAWIDARHAQVARGELVYIAHQLDFLAQIPA